MQLKNMSRMANNWSYSEENNTDQVQAEIGQPKDLIYKE